MHWGTGFQDIGGNVYRRLLGSKIRSSRNSNISLSIYPVTIIFNFKVTAALLRLFLDSHYYFRRNYYKSTNSRLLPSLTGETHGHECSVHYARQRFNYRSTRENVYHGRLGRKIWSSRSTNIPLYIYLVTIIFDFKVTAALLDLFLDSRYYFN